MFILALMLFMFFYLTGISLASEEILMILIVFVLFFISSVLLINYRVERFILNKVKGIYNDLLPSGVAQNKMVIQSDMEALKKSLQKLADDKKLEIESLKEKENYRKEFIGNISHELKTPLFTIQGYVLTLLQGAVKDKVVREKYYLLASKPDKVVKRSKIMEIVWGSEVVVGDRTIDVHIRKLREKVGDKYFKTVKGVGYKFVQPSK